MIISERIDKEKHLFENILDDSHSLIGQEAQKNPSYFLKRSATEFENDVFDAICDSAKGTDFDKTIQLISGHKFPDIVVKNFYGVEVKTTKQDHWKSTGNSVLETTRIDDVGRIYLFFGKLSNPVGFKYRRYEECLYDVAVTHSPRYLINMDLEKEKTIFDKMSINYDELRKLNNPIKPIVDYYRKIANKGEEPWWMDSDKTPEIILKPTVTLWSNLSKNEKTILRNEAMARFPEIFGKSSTKFQRLASWLAARHGIVDSSLRDRFTAGGKVDITLNKRIYKKLPRVFQHLKENSEQIIKTLMEINSEELKHHWGLPEDPGSFKKIDIWVEKIISYASEILPDSNRFIIHLLGISFRGIDSPLQVKEEMAKYGINLD